MGRRPELRRGHPDTATGLIRIGARDYDPALGRFVTVDPLLDLSHPQQANGYAYANNNPIYWVDPTGMFGWDDIKSGAGKIGGGAVNVLAGAGSSVAGTADFVVGAVVSPFTCVVNCNWVDPGLQKNYDKAVDKLPVVDKNSKSFKRGRIAGDVAQLAIPGAGIVIKAGQAAQKGVVAAKAAKAAKEARVANGVANKAANAARGGGAPARSLFHYTDEAGQKGIQASGEMTASTGAKNARHGSGQYFTDMAPEQIGARTISQLPAGSTKLSMGQVARRLFGQPFAGRKLDTFLEIDVTGLPALPTCGGGGGGG
ncbi:MAG: RHS repeat-associated core domain-containing protein [Sporichthyaceae bacterium]